MNSIKPVILIFSFSLFFVLFAKAQNANVSAILGKDTVYVDAPKTNIQIIPPAHFVLMEQAGGFLHVGTSSSIQVQEITGTSYLMITPGLTKDYFLAQKVTLLSEEDVVNISGQKGKIYTVSFFVDNVEFERLMYFTGDYNNTIWINANYPVAVKEMLNAVLKTSLLTAKFKQK